MNIISTNLPDVKLIKPQVFCDERGFFTETFRENWFQENISDCTFVQENHSLSFKNVLRGLHYQTEQPQGKLIRVISGEIFDVAVDLRCDSPTFGKWAGENLSAANRRQMWIPEGFAHGFYVLGEQAEIVYKCTDYYHPQSEQILLWNDPDIGIGWPLNSTPLISAKDANGKRLAETVCFG